MNMREKVVRVTSVYQTEFIPLPNNSHKLVDIALYIQLTFQMAMV